MSWSLVAASSLKSTSASPDERSTTAEYTPPAPISAFSTFIWQCPHVIPVTRSFNVAIRPPHRSLICPPRPAKFHAHYNLRHAIARRTDRAVAAHPGGSHPRPVARNLSLPAAHADPGRTPHRPLPPEQGNRRLVSLAGSGGGVGRLGVRPRPRAQPGHPVAAVLFLVLRPPHRSTLFPYSRSADRARAHHQHPG